MSATPWGVTRPTLPPTWTPTATYTALPPSLTPSPTETPSVTPTLSAAARCARLWLYGHPAQGAQLSIKDFAQVSFLWQYPLADEAVTLTIRLAGGDRARVLTVPGPNNVAASIPFHVLYGPGLYRWSLVPEDADGTPLADCRQEGSFVITVLRREEHRWPLPGGGEAVFPTATAEPSAPASTAEVTEPPAITATLAATAEVTEPSATLEPPITPTRPAVITTAEPTEGGG